MDAPTASTIASQRLQGSSALGRLLPLLTVISTGLLLGLLVTFICRRFAGALRQPLDASSLLLTALVLIVCSSVLRSGWRMVPAAGLWPTGPVAVSAVLSVVVMGFAFCVSLPGSPFWASVVFWVVLLAEQLGGWSAAVRQSNVARRLHRVVSSWQSTRSSASPTTMRNVNGDPLLPRPSGCVVSSFEDDPIPRAVSQRLTRHDTVQGGEVLLGVLRGDFSSRERQRSLHVAFCPPFDAAPTVSVEQIDGPRATVKVVQVESFGARLDVRLSCVTEQPTSVTIEFYAQAGSADESH